MVKLVEVDLGHRKADVYMPNEDHPHYEAIARDWQNKVYEHFYHSDVPILFAYINHISLSAYPDEVVSLKEMLYYAKVRLVAQTQNIRDWLTEWFTVTKDVSIEIARYVDLDKFELEVRQTMMITSFDRQFYIFEQ